MYTHGWGLWTALTLQTSQVDNGDRLRVFETWYTPQEIAELPGGSIPAAPPLAKAAHLPRRVPLVLPLHPAPPPPNPLKATRRRKATTFRSDKIFPVIFSLNFQLSTINYFSHGQN